MTADPPLTASAAPDEALLQAFVTHGDREAMGSVLLRHYQSAWSVARSHGLSQGDAEDAVQSAFVAALGSAQRFAGGSTVRTWLLGHVVNACRNLARAHRRRRAHEGIMPTALPSTPELERPREELAALRVALAGLPPRYRVPIELRFAHGLEPAEIARTLGAAPGTVRSLLSRGLERLRQALGRDGIGADVLGAAIALAPQQPPGGAAGAAVAAWVRGGAVPASPFTAPALGGIAQAALAGAMLAMLGIAVAVSWRFHQVTEAVVASDAPPAPLANHASPPGAAALERPLSVRFRRDDLGEALTRIAQATGLSWACPDPLLHLGSLDFSVGGVRVREGLDRIAREIGVRWELRDGAIVCWADVPDSTLDTLLARAGAGEALERCQAIAEVGALGDPRIYPVLFRGAQDGDPDVVEWSLRALRRHLGTLRFAAGVDALAAELTRRLRLLPDPINRGCAAADLDGDPHLRLIRLLAAMRSPAVSMALRAALEVRSQRQAAWAGLSAIRDPDAERSSLAAYAARLARPPGAPIYYEMDLPVEAMLQNPDLVARASLESGDQSLQDLALAASTAWPDERLLEPLQGLLARARAVRERYRIVKAIARIGTPAAFAAIRGVSIGGGSGLLDHYLAEWGDPATRAAMRQQLADPDAAKRRSALESLGTDRDDACLAPLCDLIASTDPTIVDLARRAAHGPDADAAEAMRALCSTLDPATPLGSAALRVSACARLPSSLGILAAAAGNAQVAVRALVAELLPKTRDPAALPLLVRLAGDNSAGVRQWAIRGIDADHWTPRERADALIGCLGEREINTFSLVAYGLARTGDPQALPLLAAAVPDWPLGPIAAGALVAFPDVRGGSALMPLLVAQAAQTRSNASSGWREVAFHDHDCDDGIEPRFGARLLAMTFDADERVRCEGMYGIVCLRMPTAEARLIALLDDPARMVDGGALMSLAMLLPEAKAVTAIVGCMKSADKMLRTSAVGSGAWSCLPDAGAQLLPMLRDPVADVRWTAAQSANEFAHASDPSITAELRLLLDDPNQQVRNAARFALLSIGQQVPAEARPAAQQSAQQSAQRPDGF